MRCYFLKVFGSFDLSILVGKDIRMICRSASDSLLAGFVLIKDRCVVIRWNVPLFDVMNKEAGALAEDVSVIKVATNHFIYLIIK